MSSSSDSSGDGDQPGNRDPLNNRGRLIPLHCGAPAENMALDQALLESVDAGGPAVLRFYRWSEPTLSLGYFQAWDDRQRHRDSRELHCLRRASGGGAIVHHHELTYSLVMPVDGIHAGGSSRLYRCTHQAIAHAIAELGPRPLPFRLTPPPAVPAAQTADPFLCFQRRTAEDLVLAGYKILGSAQRRGRRAVLQHGSLLLRASRHAPQLPGMFDLGSRPIAISALADQLAGSLAAALSMQWVSDAVTHQERQRTAHWISQRFAASQWLHRR